MQQIKNFAATAMNKQNAQETIVNQKYLLELIENRIAIVYFAIKSRNQALFQVMCEYASQEKQELPNKPKHSKSNTTVEMHNGSIKNPGHLSVGVHDLMISIHDMILESYDFMTLCMYDGLESRRKFVHDCWTIAKLSENQEFKTAVAEDEHFNVTRKDILVLLKT